MENLSCLPEKGGQEGMFRIMGSETPLFEGESSRVGVGARPSEGLEENVCCCFTRELCTQVSHLVF